jgi:copper chaperone CopZ
MKKLFFALLLASISLFAAEKEVNMNIKGMTCQMCAGSVKETLMKTDGVKDAKIYLKDGKAVVKTEKDIDMTALNEKLKKHGYSAELSK